MDITITPTSANPTPKSPEQHADHTESPTATATPTRIHPSSKPLSFTNGVLKRQNLHQHNHDQQLAIPSVVGVVSYKECLKNHAAALGGHALDGCGEFMPSPTADKTNPTSLKCAACGCHRNFHRREPEDPLPLPPPPNTATHVIEYQPHHRHHPLPPAQPQPQQPAGLRSRNSVSPPPISSYYPSAPHMLLALSGGMSAQPEYVGGAVVTPSPISRKRFRTKFSQNQKEKMNQFAEKVGWKMQKRDDDLVHEFCNEIGVEKGVFKVWMHNNKNTYGKKDNGAAAAATTAIGMITTNSTHHDDHNHNNIFSCNNDDNNNNNDNGSKNVNQYQNDNVGHVGTNGSSSSS